jgi:hypothetical protein
MKDFPAPPDEVDCVRIISIFNKGPFGLEDDELKVYPNRHTRHHFTPDISDEAGLT